MGMNFSMGADFEERNLEEGFHLAIMFRNPLSGHEEGGRDFLFYQIVDQRLIVARSVTHWTQVECQRDSGAGGRAGLDYLGLRNGSRRRGKQQYERQAEYP